MVKQLHDVGIVHGDLNKFKFILQGSTAKLIDFEAAVFDGNENYPKLVQEDLQDLPEKLADTSRMGDYGMSHYCKDSLDHEFLS